MRSFSQNVQKQEQDYGGCPFCVVYYCCVNVDTIELLEHIVAKATHLYSLRTTRKIFLAYKTFKVESIVDKTDCDRDTKD